MADNGTEVVIARYHPVGAILAPVLLVVVFGLFMAVPHLHEGGVDGFMAEYRKGGSYVVASLIFGPLGIGMGLLLGYRIAGQRGVAVRYCQGVFHFTQAMMVSVPADDLLDVEPTKDGFRNLLLNIRGEGERRIFGSFWDRSAVDVTRDIRAIVGLPELVPPELAYSPDRIKPRRSRRSLAPPPSDPNGRR